MIRGRALYANVRTVCRRAGPAALAFVMAGAVSVSVTAAASAPTGFALTAIDGNAVTLEWQAPSGAAPDAYVLEGGLLPGEVLGSVPLSGDLVAVTLPAPPGAFYLRMHAVVNGVQSGPSNEIRVFVNVALPLGPPENVAGMAIGSDVVLTWRNPAGQTERIVLDVTGSLAGSADLAPDGALRVSGVPDGTYTMSLRAVNATGASPSSASITVTVPGPAVAIVAAPGVPFEQPRLPVRYEHVAAARLAQLREREHLDDVIAGAADDLDIMLRLQEWVAQQFPAGNPDPYPPWDAMTVLDWIRGGYTGGFCGQYAQVLLQSLASVGVSGRYVELGYETNPYGHFVMEAWSNELGKWVVLDADFNAHYEQNGRPLSALEIHDLLLAGRTDEISVVSGAFRAGHPSPDEWPLQTLEFFYYVRYLMNGDHVSAPLEDPFNRYADMVEWSDPAVPAWEDSVVESRYPKERLTLYRTADRAQVDAGLNLVWATPRFRSPGEIAVDLQHSVVDLDYFEYRVTDDGGTAGSWQTQTGSTITWTLMPGDRQLEVRGVNVRGARGASAAVGLVP